MKDLKPYQIELDSTQKEFLDEMAATYGLPDAGKAIRCLINYARENVATRPEIFDEVRCLAC